MYAINNLRLRILKLDVDFDALYAQLNINKYSKLNLTDFTKLI